MQDQTPARVADVRVLASAIALGSVIGLAIGGAYWGGQVARDDVQHARTTHLAGVARDGFSEAALTRVALREDAGALAIARRQGVEPLAEPRDPRLTDLAARLRQARDAEKLDNVFPAKAAALEPAVSSHLHLTTTLAASPFHLRGALDETRDLECLTQAVYYEARGEPAAGQAAVAQVVLNRVRHPAYPKSVCGVVFQHAGAGCQFSFACNGSVHRAVESGAWRRSRSVAQRALDGAVMAEVGEATQFHVGGGFSAGLLKVAQIGAHVFYRFGGHAGAPAMFRAEPRPSTDLSSGHAVYASFAPIDGGRQAGHFLASTAAAVQRAFAGQAQAQPVDKTQAAQLWKVALAQPTIATPKPVQAAAPVVVAAKAPDAAAAKPTTTAAPSVSAPAKPALADAPLSPPEPTT